jgi:hypothetical protein
MTNGGGPSHGRKHGKKGAKKNTQQAPKASLRLKRWLPAGGAKAKKD